MLGSCLCKKVVYEVSQLDSAIQHCSCNSCRKAHASAFNSAATVDTDHFRWLVGEAELRFYRSSVEKRRYFCGNCGTHLVARLDGESFVILRVATLDEDPMTRPERHIWKSQEAAWLRYGAAIPEFSEWAPDGA